VADLEAFVESVRGGSEPLVTGEDAGASVLALAAQRSLDEGRPVRIDEIGWQAAEERGVQSACPPQAGAKPRSLP